MPELHNARWERFCQAIVLGLGNQKEAYMGAGYKASGNGAEVNASKLLSLTKPVIARVRELHEEQKAKLAEANRFTIQAIVRRMALASAIAEEDRNSSALTTAEASIAKLLGLQVERSEIGKPGDFTGAQSSSDIAELVLRDAGAESVPGDIRAMAVAELERHAAALASLAAACNAPPSSNQA